jgi:hypothetical protein
MSAQLPIDTLGKQIKAHIDTGDKTASEAEEHYMAAGLLLIDAKERVTHTKGLTWTKFLADQCGVGRSRANELIAIADGRTTVEEVRDNVRDRVAKHAKSRQPAAVTNGQSSEITQHDQEPCELDVVNPVDAATKEAIIALAQDYRKQTYAHTTHLALAAKGIHRAGTVLTKLKALVESCTEEDWWEFYKLNFDKPQKYAEQAMRDAAK